MTFPFEVRDIDALKAIAKSGVDERNEQLEELLDARAIFDHAMARAKSGRGKNSITREPQDDGE